MRQHIEEACVESGNTSSRWCERKFSSYPQLRVHAYQHYVNVFCLCGEYSYQRDYVLKYKRIACCHMGRTFVVDATTFGEFCDLILPHEREPWKREALCLRFPTCWSVWNDSNEEKQPTNFNTLLTVTQPLWVMLERVGYDDISDISERSTTLPRVKTEETQSIRPQALHLKPSTAPALQMVIWKRRYSHYGGA